MPLLVPTYSRNDFKSLFLKADNYLKYPQRAFRYTIAKFTSNFSPLSEEIDYHYYNYYHTYTLMVDSIKPLSSYHFGAAIFGALIQGYPECPAQKNFDDSKDPLKITAGYVAGALCGIACCSVLNQLAYPLSIALTALTFHTAKRYLGEIEDKINLPISALLATFNAWMTTNIISEGALSGFSILHAFHKDNYILIDAASVVLGARLSSDLMCGIERLTIKAVDYYRGVSSNDCCGRSL